MSLGGLYLERKISIHRVMYNRGMELRRIEIIRFTYSIDARPDPPVAPTSRHSCTISTHAATVSSFEMRETAYRYCVNARVYTHAHERKWYRRGTGGSISLLERRREGSESVHASTLRIPGGHQRRWVLMVILSLYLSLSLSYSLLASDGFGSSSLPAIRPS